MLDICPSYLNHILLKRISSNAEINIGHFHHGIVEYNSRKDEIYCHIYIPSVHQEPTPLKSDKDANIHVGNIPCKLLFCEAVFSCGNLILN